MSETIYFKGFGSAKQSKYGIRISGKLDKLIAELGNIANEKGYVNLEIKQRKEPDKFGNSHYIVVDTWEPKPKETQTGSDKSQRLSNDSLDF